MAKPFVAATKGFASLPRRFVADDLDRAETAFLKGKACCGRPRKTGVGEPGLIWPGCDTVGAYSANKFRRSLRREGGGRGRGGGRQTQREAAAGEGEPQAPRYAADWGKDSETHRAPAPSVAVRAPVCLTGQAGASRPLPLFHRAG